MTDGILFTRLDGMEKAKRQLQESASIKNAMAEILVDKITEAAIVIAECIRAGGKVILFGNGGSAADAQHLVCEFMGKFRRERMAIPAMALTTDTSVITALANEYGYDSIFERQVEAYVQPSDVVIGISAEKNHYSVINGLIKAKQMKAKTIALIGKDNGKIARVTDIVISVPSSDTPRIQEGHITIGHIICDILENHLLFQK